MKSTSREPFYSGCLRQLLECRLFFTRSEIAGNMYICNGFFVYETHTHTYAHILMVCSISLTQRTGGSRRFTAPWRLSCQHVCRLKLPLFIVSIIVSFPLSPFSPSSCRLTCRPFALRTKGVLSSGETLRGPLAHRQRAQGGPLLMDCAARGAALLIGCRKREVEGNTA